MHAFYYILNVICTTQLQVNYSCYKHVFKYCEKIYERSGKNLFWSFKNSGEILDKLKARDSNATSLSSFPHNLIKD